MDNGFTCDYTEFEELVLRLTGKEMKQSKKKALRRGSAILVSSTRKEMRASGFRFQRWMNKAVRYKVHRNGNSSKVHLFGELGETGKDRGVVRYLEMGTGERYRSVKHIYRGRKRIIQVIPGRKKGYSGKINEYGFFAKARNNSATQVENEMSSVLESEIRKISFLK